MRKSKRLNSSKIHKLLVATCTFALASTLSIAAYADPLTSNNLPVPNSIVGATLKYNNGVTVQTLSGGQITNQPAAQAAADTGKSLSVNVTSKVADIGYNTFNIGDKANVNFKFNQANQVALNRVTLTGAEYASQLKGSMTQTGSGTVFLINPNGILFGANSSVSLGSFVASTLPAEAKSLDKFKKGKSTQLEFERTDDPAGIYAEGPGSISVSKDLVLISNAIVNKDKSMTAGNNLALLTGDEVKLDIAGGAVSFSDEGDAGHEFVEGSTAENCTVTLPNGDEVLLGTINSTAGKLTAPNFTVIAKLDKDLETEYQDIVNISSTMKVGNVFMYADNAAEACDGPVGKLNIATSNIVATGNIEITADGRIKTGDLKAGGNIFLGTTNLVHEFGPTVEDAMNMARDYEIDDLIGDSITTGNITADNLVIVGKSITTKNIKVDDVVALLAAEGLSVGVNNTDNDPLGISLCFEGGTIKTGNIYADTVLAVGSSITTGQIDAYDVVMAAIDSLHLDLAYDLSEIGLEVTGGSIKSSVIDADNVILLGSSINVGCVDAYNVAALIAIDSLCADIQMTPELFGDALSVFFSGNYNEAALLAAAEDDGLFNPLPPYFDAELHATGGTITANTVEAGDVILVGNKINVDTVEADDFAVILGIKQLDLALNIGDYSPYTVDLGLHIVGGTINVNNLSAPFALELAGTINNDSVDVSQRILGTDSTDSVDDGLFAAIAVKDACLEFTYAQPDSIPDSVPAVGQLFMSIPINGTQLIDNEPYVAVEFSATTGTININSLVADTALLVGKSVSVTDWNYVNHFIKIQTGGIDISFESDDNLVAAS